MIRQTSVFVVGSLLALGISGCTQNTSENGKVPSKATSRADIEKIINAYIMDNPEVILESVNRLAERQQTEARKLAAATLANNPKDFSLGPEDAPVTIVEYFDYNCGFCKKSFDWLQQRIDSNDGNIRVVFKEFPIFGEQSETAALAALAAQKQGKYFEYHQALMKEKAGSLTQEKLDEIAGETGLDMIAFKADMASPELKEHLDATRSEGIAFGVEATPYFFINGDLVPGFDVALLESRIADILNNAE